MYKYLFLHLQLIKIVIFMDIVERLAAFRDYTGLTNSQFADRAGIPRPTLSQFLSGRNKRLSDEFTVKLHAAYPNLNVLWLLFGEGDMVTDANIEFSEGKNAEKKASEAVKPTDNEVADGVQVPYSAVQENAAKREPDLFSAAESQPSRPEVRSQQLSSAFTAAAAESEKKIQSIMVFYTDNSYEAFYPAPSAD